MDAVAFALRAEFEGTETVQHPDGSTEAVPKYGGGLLAVSGGDFNVAEELEAGGGTIVVQTGDQQLVDVLSVYPPLKQVPVPEKAKPVSKYDRQPLESLREQASLRDIAGAASLSKAKLVRALEAQDRDLAAGRTASAAAVAAAPEAPAVGDLSIEKLAAVLDNDTDTFDEAGEVEVPAALEELRKRAADGVKSATAALESRDLAVKEG